MAKSDYTDRLIKAIGQKNWKAFKEADDVYGTCDLPDGVYVVRLMRASYGFTKKDEPYVAFNFVVTEGDYKGQKPRKYHGINEQGRRTIQDALKYLSIDFQRMGIDATKIDINTFEDVCNELSETKPYLKILFQNSENPNWAPDVAIKAVLETPQWEQDAEQEEEPEEEEEEETPKPKKKRAKKKTAKPVEEEPEEEEEEEEEAAEDEAEDEDDDTIVIPEVGDTGTCAPTGRGRPVKIVVVAVDEENETCDIKNPKTKKVHKEVPFARIDLDDIPF